MKFQSFNPAFISAAEDGERVIRPDLPKLDKTLKSLDSMLLDFAMMQLRRHGHDCDCEACKEAMNVISMITK